MNRFHPRGRAWEDFPSRWLGFLVLPLMLSGCLAAPEIAEMVDVIDEDLESAWLSPKTEVRIGSGLLGLARTVIGWSDDPDREEILTLLEGLDAVHVGIYRVRPIDGERPRLSEHAWSPLQEDGWRVFARVRSRFEGERVVLARVEQRDVTGLYVIALEREELAVVKLEGELSRCLDYAARRDPQLFAVAHHVGSGTQH